MSQLGVDTWQFLYQVEKKEITDISHSHFPGSFWSRTDLTPISNRRNLSFLGIIWKMLQTSQQSKRTVESLLLNQREDGWIFFHLWGNRIQIRMQKEARRNNLFYCPWAYLFIPTNQTALKFKNYFSKILIFVQILNLFLSHSFY